MSLDHIKDGCFYFKFEHNKEYRQVQLNFWEAVASLNPQNIVVSFFQSAILEINWASLGFLKNLCTWISVNSAIRRIWPRFLWFSKTFGIDSTKSKELVFWYAFQCIEDHLKFFEISKNLSLTLLAWKIPPEKLKNHQVKFTIKWPEATKPIGLNFTQEVVEGILSS